jgi:PIN domain nuclease of toxin-antitoxin system
VASVAYLDTHVAAWLYSGEGARLSAAARKTVEGSDLLISPAVVLELQFLFELKRIADAGQTIADDLRGRLGVQICDMPFADVVRKSLNFAWTRDPFDRLIAAQAAYRESPLVTKDRVLRRRYSTAVW